MAKKILRVVDVGRRAYQPILDFQEKLVGQRKAGRIPDTLVLVEHEPVYTLGRNADEAHVLAPEDELARRGIEVVHTSRGGDVTFHGPGQLVGYPIMDLGSQPKKVVWYVSRLEKTLVKVLADHGLKGGIDRQNRGVWIGDEKIAALGVRITGGVTMHGFALNVSVDLAYYDAIVPCGITGKGVTSLDRLVGNVAMDEVKAQTINRFAEVFGYSNMETLAASDAGLDT